MQELSFDAFVRDLESVVDAAGLERFPLLGISQGCAVSIAYAVRHPERVEQLMLYGGFARGRRMRGLPDRVAQAEAMMTLMRKAGARRTRLSGRCSPRCSCRAARPSRWSGSTTCSA